MAYPIPIEEVESYCVPPAKETKDLFFHHVNYRIKDPKVTLKFYSEMLGMSLVHVLDLPGFRTSLYFMGYCDDVPTDREQRWEYCLARRGGLLEFMYHWGSEKVEGLPYATGNTRDGKGYSHICVRSADPYAAAKRLMEKGVEFVKKVDEGEYRGYCYFRDPDGYWLEILGDGLPFHPDGINAPEQVQAFTYPK